MKIENKELLKTATLGEFIQLETNGKIEVIKSKREFYDYLRLLPEDQSWRGLYPRMISMSELVVESKELLVIKHLRELGFDFPLRIENIWVKYDENFDYSVFKDLGIDKDLLIYIEREDDVNGIHPIIRIIEDENVSSVVVKMTVRTLLLNYSFDEEMIERITWIIDELYKRNNISDKAKKIIFQLSKFFSTSSIIIGSLLVGRKITSNTFKEVYSKSMYINGSFSKLLEWFDDDMLKEYYYDIRYFDLIESTGMFKWMVKQKIYIVESLVSKITYIYSQSHYDKYKSFIDKFIDDDVMVKIFEIVSDYEYNDFIKNLKKMELDTKKYPKTFSMLMDEPTEIV